MTVKICIWVKHYLLRVVKILDLGLIKHHFKETDLNVQAYLQKILVDHVDGKSYQFSKSLILAFWCYQKYQIMQAQWKNRLDKMNECRFNPIPDPIFPIIYSKISLLVPVWKFEWIDRRKNDPILVSNDIVDDRKRSVSAS